MLFYRLNEQFQIIPIAGFASHNSDAAVMIHYNEPSAEGIFGILMLIRVFPLNNRSNDSGKARKNQNDITDHRQPGARCLDGIGVQHRYRPGEISPEAYVAEQVCERHASDYNPDRRQVTASRARYIRNRW
jgi:hypothetical protein